MPEEVSQIDVKKKGKDQRQQTMQFRHCTAQHLIQKYVV